MKAQIQRTALMVVMISVVLVQPTAQSADDSIEGVYQLRGVPSAGLRIERLSDGNLLFEEVFISSEGEVTPFEWQSAYVVDDGESDYLFYWHTGRYEDMPGTNKLIVYRLRLHGRRLSGSYWFPEEPATPEANVLYTRR